MQSMKNGELNISQKISAKQSFGTLFLVAFSMTLISWQKWPDIIVDYGIRVYVPWQLMQGKVLYKDIAYLNGPASVYFHALIFKLLGPGILILSGLNMLIVASLTYIIHTLFIKIGTQLSALVTSLTFLIVFAFSQYVITGNYNFISPYANELTHGIFLSFLAIHQLTKYLEKRRSADIVIIGALTGLIFLTKPEVFLAEFISILLCLGIAFRMENLPRKTLTKNIALFVGPLMFFPFLFFLYFSSHMSFSQSFISIFNPWIFAANESVRQLLFYQSIMGIDEPGHNLFRMALFSILFVICYFIIFFLNHLLRGKPNQARSFSVLASLVISGLAVGFYYDISWIEFPRPLPVFMFILGVFLFTNLQKNCSSQPRRLIFLCLTIFSSLLMLKMILNVHVYHYGFALAMPATLVFIKVILDELPEFSNKVSGTSVFFKSVGLTLIFLYCIPHIWVSYNHYRKKTFQVGRGLDTIYTYEPYFSPRSQIVFTTMDYIEKNFEPEATFTSFPYSIMFNYLSRRENPGKFSVYSPVEWNLFGDHRVIESMQTNPPSYILITSIDFEEYGYKTFGKDYAKSLYAWILENYSKVKLVGQDPMNEEGFGIQILKKHSFKNP
jgi:hypothetical protein